MMFELARLELRWLTRPSRGALIRGIRSAMRREGVVEAAGPDRERWSEGLTSHADRILDARLEQEARELALGATDSFRRRYGPLVSAVIVTVQRNPGRADDHRPAVRAGSDSREDQARLCDGRRHA